MQDPQVTTEPIIGRRVSAKRNPPSPLRRKLASLENRLDLTQIRERPVKIEVSDVDWDTPDTLVVDDSALKKIARHYYPAEPLDDPIYFDAEGPGLSGSTDNLDDFQAILSAMDESRVLRVATDPDNLEDE